MELSIDLNNIEKGLLELFKYAFTTNCALDDESITMEESKSLEELDPSETLENFKDLVLTLLKFKKDFKSLDSAELVQRSEQFETLLQKMEAEVRTHIRVQHQLKLHIDNNQQRIDDLEKIESNDKMVIKELESKCKKNGKIGETEKLKREMEEKVKNLMEVVDKKEKSLKKVEVENTKLKNLLEEKVRELESVKKDLVKLVKPTPKALVVNSGSEQIKKKWDSQKLQKGLRERGNSSEIKSERRLGDSESSKLNLSPYLKKEVVVGRKQELGVKYCPGKTHGRSNSEQKILTWKRF